MHKLLNIQTKRQYTDSEVVLGLQARQHTAEEWFYNNSKRYFMDHFKEVFFDEDKRAEIFQDSFVRLWTQIENREISIVDNVLCRQQKNGEKKPMTCSLNTFLFAIAKNEYRELVRSSKDLYVEEFFDCNNPDILYHPGEDDEAEVKIRIVDECIQMMPPRCLEILTLFYIQGKSLDEIMEIRKDKNTSKVGLKSAKYKCMTTLREKITKMFNQLNLTI